MDLTKYQHTDTITIAASPEAVYDLVADITRMGEWSPACTGGSWNDDDHTWFTGTNQAGELKWETKCRVDVAERGREFTFTNCGFDGAIDLVRWSYRFEPDGDGCRVTESWEVLPAYPDFIAGVLPNMTAEEYLDGVKPTTQQGIAETLASLKAAAES